MGDAHVGLQARLMSQALRKLTGIISNLGLQPSSSISCGKKWE
jgi:RecA/RadA recombinase